MNNFYWDGTGLCFHAEQAAIFTKLPNQFFMKMHIISLTKGGRRSRGVNYMELYKEMVLGTYWKLSSFDSDNYNNNYEPKYLL
ncbi:hypothetical protein [Cuspidothrix issatschenkoi]|uniref:hypothetical protein n=1 Tax=Cuspidothrix issatschenkoi TaxID=230752 RepID=UPI0018824695|nr:hypothetical protein [Cuspidothrix issatschenkoi]